MNKAELITEVAHLSGLTKNDAGKAVNALVTAVQEAVKNNDKVALVGFGSWEAKYREERKGVNPKTGEEITVAARKSVSFKPGKEFKDIVNA